MDISSFISGAISGTVQTIIGHPFDTIKTIYQSGNHIQSKFFYNPSNLYRGSLYPFILGITTNSIIFGSHQNIHTYLNSKYSNITIVNNITNSFIAGGISGFYIGIFMTPFENFKILAQTQLSIKDNISKYGFIKTIYRGTSVTTARETLAMSSYFATYDIMKYYNYNPLISGFIAGIVNWTLTYPIDTVKTRIQSYKSNTITHAWNTGNIWKGIPIVLIRAGIVNASIFYTYENVRKIII